MGRVASELVDYAIITSDNPRTEDPGTILDQVRAGFDADDACSLVEDRREAIAHGLAMAESGDIVLIAGKGHENFQDFGTRVVPFDDRAVARELLESV
jgi:UDP-N-acetylmuramoyl-L-alanyl-D-glutamate--2,6-diaminopimelate ligase